MTDLNTDRDVVADAQRFLRQCGSCDAGLPMDCTCPTGDYRAVMAQLVGELERLRARDHIAELAIAYVNEPEDTDVGRVTQLYHELEAAVRHMHAVSDREARP